MKQDNQADRLKNDTQTLMLREGVWYDLAGMTIGRSECRLGKDSDGKVQYPKCVEEAKQLEQQNNKWPSKWRDVARSKDDAFYKFLGDLKDQHVIDWGGGTGKLALQILEQNPEALYSTDLRKEALVISNRSIERINSDTILHDIGRKSCFDDDLADVSICKSVLLMLTEDEIDIALEELKRTTDSNGDIIISIVHPEWLWNADIQPQHSPPRLKENEAQTTPLDLENYTSGQPIYRPLQWYKDKFKECGLHIADEKTWNLSDDSSLDIPDHYKSQIGKPCYYMAKLKQDV